MSAFNAHCDTEAELHTVGALLCALETASFDYLTKDSDPIASAILNLIQVIAERVEKAQGLHDAEAAAHRADRTEESAVARAFREFMAHRAWVEDTNLTEDEVDAANDKAEGMLVQIVAMRSESPADTVIKFLLVTQDYEALYGNPHREALEAEARAFVA